MTTDDILEKVRKNAEPCPFCGSKDLKFDYRMSYGHGDCGFDRARILCNNCSGSKGDGYDYGKPTHEDELKAYQQWNTRSI